VTTRIVTGYVPIRNHPRSEEQYRALGAKLLGIDNVMMFDGDLNSCWLYGFMISQNKVVTHSVGDNPVKNSLAYHIVQAEKTEFLRKAATIDLESDIFVWIDYGIFHVPGITKDVILRFIERTEGEKSITIPGCWDKSYKYDDAWPCWRWCGGVMVVPRQYVLDFDCAMKTEYIDWIEKTNNVSWEVNALARLERNDRYAPLWWYGPCDHNASMFTNYRGTERADGKI
jgi:hypothetical protein